MSENDPTGLGPGEDEASERLPNPNITMSSPGSQAPEVDDLNERFSQQQVMISQLKEMVIAEEAARTQKIASSRLKMEKCVSQLARIRDRAKVTKLKNASDSSTASPKPSQQAVPVERDVIGDNPPSPSVAIKVPSTPDPPTTSIAVDTNPAISTASPTVLTVPQKSAELGTKTKTPSREVTKMLHQQIKEHKAMIAERAKNEKELEVALAKIQKQLEESQIQSTDILQLGQSRSKVSGPVSLPDPNPESYKVINELRSKITILEGNILDLQETCKEKDSVIDSKTKAITLMSADLSKKGKNTLDLLDDTKEQMQKMQENFASMESKMKSTKQDISDELAVCKNRIVYLEEANSILETERFNLSIQNNNLEEQLSVKEEEINKMKTELLDNLKNIEELTLKVDRSIEKDSASHEEKGSEEISKMNALSEKIEILENLNSILRQSNIELQEKINPTLVQDVSLSPSKQVKEDSPKPSKKAKAVPKAKGSQKYKTLPKPEVQPKTTETKDAKELQETIQRLEIIIQSLNKQVLDKEILLTRKEAECIELKESLNTSTEDAVDRSLTTENSESIERPIESALQPEQEIASDTAPASLEESLSSAAIQDSENIENIDTSGQDSIQQQLENASKEISKLSKELTEANKNMLKVKVSHKAKIKQMQKSIDDFSKVSDSHSEMVRLQGEVAVLTQKIAVLEEDKGNLQLHLVDYDSGRVSDSQLHAKLLEMETIAEERLKAIADLEAQKFDLVQELHSVQQQMSGLEDKVSDLTYFENEHVSAELKSAQLEEQLDVLTAKNKELLTLTDGMKAEKVELSSKLEWYIQENIDLIDRLDKLSTEKVSSAESIEMVESLTTQEKMEIEQYEKRMDSAHADSIESSHLILPESSVRRDSSPKLNMESSELQEKIDLFTQERHEVMEKLDILKNENIALSSRLEELLREKDVLEEEYKSLKITSGNIADALKMEEEKNKLVNDSIDSLKQENRALLEQIKKLFTEESVKIEHSTKEGVAEATDTIEKQPSESPQSTDSANAPESEVKESVVQLESAEKSPKMSAKDSKKFTKEILRLKNVIKQQETEMQNLSAQLSEFKDLSIQNESLLSDKSALGVELQNALQDKESLSEELIVIKNEKNMYNEQLRNLQTLLDELNIEKHSLLQLSEEKDTQLQVVQNDLKTKDEYVDQLISSNQQYKLDIVSYTDLISTKDIEISEYIEQINKLDSVSKKLKSTVTQYEEQLSSTQHTNVIKNLEATVNQLRNVIFENETKIKELEADLLQSTNSSELLNRQLLEHQSAINELKKTLNDNQREVSSVNSERDERNNEILRLQEECSRKDAEIHEVKLELRKESREHDKIKDELKSAQSSKDEILNRVRELEESCLSFKDNEVKLQEECSLLDKKSKEQYEKMKKFAANIKKKAAICSDLENQVASLKTQLFDQVKMCEELSVNNKSLQQESHVLNSQLNVVQSEMQQASSSQMSMNLLEHKIVDLETQLSDFQSRIATSLSQVDTLTHQNQELLTLKESLLIQLSEKEFAANQLTIENISLTNKLGNQEQELESTKQALSKIDILEHQVHEKQDEISNLVEKLDDVQSNYDNFKCGHEAKIQERDLYIENLEGEILKHKDRISRLEESVSTMEERRSSLERKTDHLVTKLNEKDDKCSESSIYGDELEKRLAALIVHDELIQRQLKDTQNENNEYVQKVDSLTESNKQYKCELESARSIINALTADITNLQALEEERMQACERVTYLENELKRVSVEYSDILKKKITEYEYLESDLHSQISNSELQRRMSKEQYERLQDDMHLQTQSFKELRAEHDYLKSEHENVSQKLQAELLKNENHNVRSNESLDYERRLQDLSSILSIKEQEIDQLTLKLQEAAKSTAVTSSPPETQLKNYFTDNSGEFETIMQQKEFEVEKVNNQFKTCLSQLSEAVDAEKSLKDTCLSLTNSLNEKDCIINKLQSELALINLSNQLPAVTEVVESVCSTKNVQPSSAYSIGKHVTDPIPPMDEDLLKSLQDQIIPTEALGPTSSSDLDKHMIRSFVHDPAEPVQREIEISTHGTFPVNEEILQPKVTYLCQKPADNLEEEDGWGWGGQESALGEQNIDPTVNQGIAIWDPQKVQDLELRVQQLIQENNKISADLLQSQQKVTKALLKLKEFKSKNDILNKELKNLKSTSDFNMLDMTIQDELASQAKKLEDKIKEMTSEMSKEKLEKDGLLKRIDVLTSANERLLEMKERQDVEMDVFKMKNKGLSERIKNLEWDSNFSDETETADSKIEASSKSDVEEVKDDKLLKQISDLNKKIQDLEADNEELLTFMEEQQTKSKSLEADLEKMKREGSVELDEVRKENDNLKSKLSEINENNTAINSEIEKMKLLGSSELSDLKTINDSLSEKLENLQQRCDTLNSEVLEYKAESVEVAQVKNENTNLKEQLKELLVTSAEKVSLEQENTNLKDKLEALVKEYYEYQKEFNEMAMIKDKIEIELKFILKESEELKTINNALVTQEAECKAELIKILYENEELTEKYDNILKKLNNKNIGDETNQIITYTDQLHTQSQELDAKNSELIELNKKVNSYETKMVSLQDNIDKLNSENAALLSNLAELRNNVTDAIDQRGAEVAEMWKLHLGMRETEFSNIEQSLRDSKEILETQLSHSNDLYNDCNKALEETKKQLDATTEEKERYKMIYENDLPQELNKSNSLLQDKETHERIIKEKDQEIFTLNQEVLQLKSVSEKISEYEQIISLKNKELEDAIIHLKQIEENYNTNVYAFNNKESEFEYVRQQLQQAESKMDDLAHENEAELANLRLKFHDERTSFENIIAELKNKVDDLEIQLETKINECKSLNIKIQELQKLINDDNTQLQQLRKVLETQEIEIVTMRENIALQTDAYEQLAISHLQENFKNKSERHVTFSEDTKPGVESEAKSSSSSFDSQTPRADLDLALYMLHQRDVRCEELTVELMQLLEERDTLQLKLSNSLRANEDLRSKRSPSQTIAADGSTYDVPQQQAEVGATGVSEPRSSSEGRSDTVDSAAEKITTENKSLETKISQLHKVGHTRDIRLRDEREHRNRQMELLQRDVQHLPPEAAARLREAHYTLTRDTQSASTVLLNWLWGKTTPKVVHM